MNPERRAENRKHVPTRISPIGSAFFILLSLFAGSDAYAAQPVEPPRPARFQMVLRYDIPAARDQHVVQYDALIAHLKTLGFTFDPPLSELPATDREDRSKNKLHGFMASDKVLKVFGNPDVASL